VNVVSYYCHIGYSMRCQNDWCY